MSSETHSEPGSRLARVFHNASDPLVLRRLYRYVPAHQSVRLVSILLFALADCNPAHITLSIRVVLPQHTLRHCILSPLVENVSHHQAVSVGASSFGEPSIRVSTRAWSTKLRQLRDSLDVVAAQTVLALASTKLASEAAHSTQLPFQDPRLTLHKEAFEETLQGMTSLCDSYRALSELSTIWTTLSPPDRTEAAKQLYKLQNTIALRHTQLSRCESRLSNEWSDSQRDFYKCLSDLTNENSKLCEEAQIVLDQMVPGTCDSLSEEIRETAKPQQPHWAARTVAGSHGPRRSRYSQPVPLVRKVASQVGSQVFLNDETKQVEYKPLKQAKQDGEKSSEPASSAAAAPINELLEPTISDEMRLGAEQLMQKSEDFDLSVSACVSQAQQAIDGLWSRDENAAQITTEAFDDYALAAGQLKNLQRDAIELLQDWERVADISDSQATEAVLGAISQVKSHQWTLKRTGDDLQSRIPVQILDTEGLRRTEGQVLDATTFAMPPPVSLDRQTHGGLYDAVQALLEQYKNLDARPQRRFTIWRSPAITVACNAGSIAQRRSMDSICPCQGRLPRIWRVCRRRRASLSRCWRASLSRCFQ